MDVFNLVKNIGLTTIGSLGPIGSTISGIINSLTAEDVEVNEETSLDDLNVLMLDLPEQTQAIVVELLTKRIEEEERTKRTHITELGSTKRLTEAEITKRLEIFTANDTYSNLRPRAYLFCVLTIIIVTLGYFGLVIFTTLKPEYSLPAWETIALLLGPVTILAERYQKRRSDDKGTKASIINDNVDPIEMLGKINGAVGVVSKITNVLKGTRK